MSEPNPIPPSESEKAAPSRSEQASVDPRLASRTVHPFSPRLALGAGISLSLGLVFLVDAGRLEVHAVAAFAVALVLVLAWAWVERSFLAEVARERHLPHGLNNTLFLVLAAGLCLTVNLLAHRYTQRIPGLERWDLTRNAFFSFTPQTLDLLKTLKKPVQVLAFFSYPRERNRTAALQRGQRASVERLLRLYGEYCPQLTWRMIDPEKDPMTAKRHGVRHNGTVVLTYGDQTTTLREYDFFTGPKFTVPKFKGEQAMTSALLKLTRTVRPKVHFLVGHGEATIEDRSASGMAAMAEQLVAENYRVGELNLITEAGVPEDCACLVIAGPRKPLDPRELEVLQAFLDRGGCALFLLDTQPLPGIARLLEHFEILWRRNVVIDPKDCYFRRHSMPLPQLNEHAITTPLIEAGLRPVFDEATAFGQTAWGGKRFHLRTIAQSSAYSWAETKLSESNVAFEPDQDEFGPLILATACTTDRSLNSRPKRQKASEYRLVAIGDSHFARNRLQGVQGNADFFLNCVNWLTGEADRVTIRPKIYEVDRAVLSESWGRWIFYGCVFCLPGLVLAIGLGVHWRRRSL